MSRLFSGTSLDRPPLCDRCGKAPADCRCMPLPPKKKMSAPAKAAPTAYELTPQNSSPPPDQLAKIKLEKRKGNRVVTLITGLDHPANDLPKLCTLLKSSLATGGSVQERTIELQGDHTQRTLAILTAQNMKARLV